MKILFRITGSGTAYAVLADEDTPAATQDKISAYKPSLSATPQSDPLPVAPGQPFAQFIYGRSGRWTISFLVDRQHASADAALLFMTQQAALLANAGQFDLQIVVGAQTVYLPACALTSFDPEPHSDQSTLIKYAFVGASYTTNAP